MITHVLTIVVSLSLFHTFFASTFHCNNQGRRAGHLLDLKDSDFKAHRVAEVQGRVGSKFPKYPVIWYLAQPTYSCTDTKRVGFVTGDGGKYICELYRLPSMGEKCLYYGLGVNNEINFDIALRKELPLCEMHTFDPSSLVEEKTKMALAEIDIAFHSWGLSANVNGHAQIAGQNVPVFTLAGLREKLGHTRPITILKVDVEGAEWGAFDTIFANCNRSEPMFYQLQVELHFPNTQKLMKFSNGMDRCGYRLFSADTNYLCLNCMEYAWVHENFLHCHI